MTPTDARLRPATSVELATELNKLFRSLELKSGSPEQKIEGYLIALTGASHYALTTAIAKIIRGEVPDLSRKFCPTPPELGAVVRGEMEFVQKQIALAQERMTIEDKRPVAAPTKLLHERIADAERRMAEEGRALLFKVMSHGDMLSRRREMPAGARYISILGAVYGPPGSASAADPPQIDDDIPW